jgi:hypothetical protein
VARAKRGSGEGHIQFSLIVEFKDNRIVSSTPLMFCNTSLFQKRKDAITFGNQECVASTISHILRVLSAVHFDNELSLTTDKIGNVRSDRFLANKLEAAEATITDSKPKLRFGIGGDLAQSADFAGCLAVWSAHRVSPSPGPRFARTTLSPLRGARVMERAATGEVYRLHRDVSITASSAFRRRGR